MTILNLNQCRIAGRALSGDASKWFRFDQPADGYSTPGSGNTGGCTFHSGNVNNDIQFFPYASGSCGLYNFHCICGAFAPIPDASWHTFVDACLAEAPVTGECTAWASGNNYGTMPNWDTSSVTDMSSTFEGYAQFDGDVSRWDTSSVATMSVMFKGASSFNQDIGNWNTAEVTNMNGMFFIASAFDQDIGNWNTEKVTDMYYMFFEAFAFNQDIWGWNTAEVTAMNGMFRSASAFNQDIGGWNTEKVTSMEYMFHYASAFNQDIGSWNTAEVTSMEAMFSSASAFNHDISSWTGSAATTAQTDMFFGATAFEANFACDDAVSGPASSCDVRPMDQMPWSGTVNNGEVTLNGDAKSDYTVYVWHADVHTGGYAYVQFHYADGVVDEIRHTGNGSRKFLKSDGTWTGWFAVGSHGTTLRTQLGLVKYYDIDCTQVAGTSTWYFTTSSGSVSKIVLKEDSDWGGMKSVEVYRES